MQLDSRSFVLNHLLNAYIVTFLLLSELMYRFLILSSHQLHFFLQLLHHFRFLFHPVTKLLKSAVSLIHFLPEISLYRIHILLDHAVHNQGLIFSQVFASLLERLLYHFLHVLLYDYHVFLAEAAAHLFASHADAGSA